MDADKQIKGLCTAQSEATKNKAYVQIQHMWLWFHLLRNSIFMVWNIWSSYILKIIPRCRGFTNYKFPVVLLICSHTIINKGNSFIETFQNSKVCILLEWFNPCKYQEFPLSHGWFGTWSGWKSSLFTWAFTERCVSAKISFNWHQWKLVKNDDKMVICSNFSMTNIIGILNSGHPVGPAGHTFGASAWAWHCRLKHPTVPAKEITRDSKDSKNTRTWGFFSRERMLSQWKMAKRIPESIIR